MSDGPHRSLNMRRGWKRFAERADKEAYAPEEVCAALPDALEQDWRAEVPPGLFRQVKDVLQERQDSLFGDQRADKLESIRCAAAGNPLATTLLDCAIHEVSAGRPGDQAISNAVSAALAERAIRGSRQVEEHYFRSSSCDRATNVRDRMNEGIARIDMKAVAERLIGARESARPSTAVKRTGLDEGVSL